MTDVDTVSTYLTDLWSAGAIKKYIDICELDVIMLRNDPVEDVIHRPWARLAGVNFARFAAQRGVMVINDPEDEPNMNQVIETVSRDGYIVAQEYLPDAVHGDTRLFLLNGRPMEHGGTYAAFRRVRSDGDMRSNITVGAKSAPTVITEEILEMAETIRPQLINDGMFFVGLDIVGNKLMEINVFSPGGLKSAEAFTCIKFSQLVICDLERKLDFRNNSDRHISNVELAVF